MTTEDYRKAVESKLDEIYQLKINCLKENGWRLEKGWLSGEYHCYGDHRDYDMTVDAAFCAQLDRDCEMETNEE